MGASQTRVGDGFGYHRSVCSGSRENLRNCMGVTSNAFCIAFSFVRLMLSRNNGGRFDVTVTMRLLVIEPYGFRFTHVPPTLSLLFPHNSASRFNV